MPVIFVSCHTLHLTHLSPFFFLWLSVLTGVLKAVRGIKIDPVLWPDAEEELHCMTVWRKQMPSCFSGVSKDHTYFLSDPLGLRTTLWVAEMALAKCYFHTYTHMHRHTYIRTHMPDSSPRETWLLWRKSNQVAVTMETDLIGPSVCARAVSLSPSLVTTRPPQGFVQLTFYNLRKT